MSPPAFETIMPEIASRSCRHFSHLRAAARDEAVAESVAQAWGLYRSAVASRNFRFTPCSLAWFANRAVDEGRKFSGGTIKKDALDRGRAISFDDLDEDGRSRIAEALIQRQTPVLDQARIRIDWPEFLRQDLTEREAWMTDELAAGSTRSEIAGELGLSPARVTQLFGRVAEAYEEKLGTPGFEHRARKQQKRQPERKTKKPQAAA